jgi:ribosome maturation factor RimP
MIADKLAVLGYDLYDIKLARTGTRGHLRIFIDKESGITIDDCENASNEISMLLDVENFADTPYTLEVSSPGLDRPLLTERDFKRAIGQKVLLYFHETGTPIQPLTGMLTACRDGQLVMQTTGDIRSIALSSVRKGKIEITFK